MEEIRLRVYEGGTKHLSDASLMAGHSSFIEPLASSSSLGCWGQQENSLSILPFSYMSLYTYQPHSIILPPYAHFPNYIIQ